MRIKPFVEIPSVVNDPTPELSINGAAAKHTPLWERVGANPEILGGLGRTQLVMLGRLHLICLRRVGARRGMTRNARQLARQFGWCKQKTVATLVT
jgi:hypothetical protein